MGLRPGPGEASGGSPESFWDLRSGRKVVKINEFGVFSWGKEGSAYIELTREKGFSRNYARGSSDFRGHRSEFVVFSREYYEKLPFRRK